MNTRTSVLLLTFCWLTSASADLTIVQKVEGPSPIDTMTMKFKGDKVRVEVSPEITTILDGKTGDIMTILNSQKRVMHLSGDQAKMLGSMASSAVAVQAPKLIPTGRKETINGYDTEEYKSDNPEYKATFWIAPKFPDYAEVLKQMQAMQGGALATMSKGLPNFADLPGMPIRTRMNLEGQGEFTHTIMSVKHDPLPDSEFAAPKDFKEMSIPGFPHGSKKNAAGE